MEEKITKKYIALSKGAMIGNKKRNTFTTKFNATNSPKFKNTTIRKSRGCSGCSRKRKIKSG